MKAKYCYEYPRPAVTVDIVLFYRKGADTSVLLIQRANPPFAGSWAFPGGFVDENETLEQAAGRELMEETGISGVELRQFRAYSEPKRDPRHRTITLVFVGFAEAEMPVQSGDDARAARWFSLNQLPPLAFDHGTIVEEVVAALNLK